MLQLGRLRSKNSYTEVQLYCEYSLLFHTGRKTVMFDSCTALLRGIFWLVHFLPNILTVHWLYWLCYSFMSQHKHLLWFWETSVHFLKRCSNSLRPYQWHYMNHFVSNHLKMNSLKFWEICVFIFLLWVKWKDWYHLRAWVILGCRMQMQAMLQTLAAQKLQINEQVLMGSDMLIHGT